MLHRCAYVTDESILINGGAAGGVGTALIQLGKLAGLKKMYGTTSNEKRGIVSDLGGIPIDYKSVELVQEIINITSLHDNEGERGVDAVFDGIGGKSLKASYEILRSGGRLVEVKPIISARMPLNQAAQAHELRAGGSITGKIVLICNN
jgi:NADPH2:quinone reductase